MVTLDQADSPAPTTGAAHDAYDVVVVGGGMGGVTAGALLARAGRRVLVVDANARPGGYARAITHGPYTFDTADHLINGCEPAGPFGDGIIDAVLQHLGVRDRCEFVRVDAPFYVSGFPDFTLAVPGGREAYLDAHARHFPGEARALCQLIELSAQIAREQRALPIAPDLEDPLADSERFPASSRYRDATVQQAIDQELTDPHLKGVYTTLAGWVDTPVRASFLMWASMMADYVEGGGFYCRGSFQRLADAVAEGLTRAGGELLPGTRVTRILAHDRRVQGVELENGQTILAPVVISNADARETFERLLGREQLPSGFVAHLQGLALSGVAAMLYLATDLDARALGAQHETMLTTAWEPAQRLANFLAGRPSDLFVGIPTLTDPSLAPTGEHLVILSTGAPPGANEMEPAESDRFAAGMLERAERVLPGLRKHLTHVEGAGPGTAARFPLQLWGPIYGWAVTPQQFGARRLPQQTPVAGLYLAGQWTQPGPGISNVVQSGVQAARLVLDVALEEPALPLRLPVMPRAA